MSAEMPTRDGQVSTPKQTVPELLILNLEAAVRPLLNYIESGYHKRYIDINSLINDLLNTVCTDEPYDALQDRIMAIQEVLIEEEYEPYDVYNLVQQVEVLGLVLIRELEDMGFYTLPTVVDWGYQIMHWLNPALPLLRYCMDWDVTSPVSRIQFLEEEEKKC